MRPASTSRAPSAIALAALPTANTAIGARKSAPRRYRATQARPSTARSPASNSSRSEWRALIASALPIGVGSGFHDFEAAAIGLAARGLGGIRALGFQSCQIFGRDVAGHVIARETRGVEFLDARMIVYAGGDQVFQVLVDEPVRTDEIRDFVVGAFARHQFAR